MKKIIITLLLLPMLLFSQNNSECRFIPTQEYFDTFYTGQSYQRPTSYTGDYIMNIKFHLISDNGINVFNITENDLLCFMSIINNNFNQFGIYFKYNGYDFLENTDFAFDYVNDYPTNLNNIIADASSVGLHPNDMLNIYIIHGGNSGSINGTFIDYATIQLGLTDIYIHEIGHALGLLHVFSGNSTTISNADMDCDFHTNQYFLPVHGIGVENITRDSNDPNFNATTAGDMIADTGACFYNFNNNICLSGDYYEHYLATDDSDYPDLESYYCSQSKLEYRYHTGDNYYTIIDSDDIETTVNFTSSQNWNVIISTLLTNCDEITQGQMFRGLESINRNYMSYGYNDIRDNFTQGQGVRMRQTILNNANNDYFPKLATLPNGDADYSVLCQPFDSHVEVDMDNNNIISVDDDPNNPGYMIVCRPQYLIHKFQPEFEYHIYKVNNGYYLNGDIVNPDDATLLEIIPSGTNCNTSYAGTYLAVKIPDFSDNIIMFEDIVCVSTESCSSEPITLTTIFSTDNLGSSNGTTQILDAQQSANPNLENDLESQKYHNIKKTTNSGAQKSKTVYKN